METMNQILISLKRQVNLLSILEFEADRKKTNFEKDMDSLLFGGGPAPPRRRKPA